MTLTFNFGHVEFSFLFPLLLRLKNSAGGLIRTTVFLSRIVLIYTTKYFVGIGKKKSAFSTGFGTIRFGERCSRTRTSVACDFTRENIVFRRDVLFIYLALQAPGQRETFVNFTRIRFDEIAGSRNTLRRGS